MTTSQAATDEDLFANGGENGARMRAIDWSKTSLGPVAGWPRSLKTCIRIVLTSRQPMFVWWGEELINLYNDAYKTIVGGKHPEALGQPASVVWREIWDQVGPRAERAMRLGEGTYDEALLLIMERYGYEEETYYTFSYSPVPNDDGKTGGLICANTDDTERIIGERRLATLRELAAATADARTVEHACARAASSLVTNSRDLPFSLVYLIEPGERAMSLAGACGVEAGSAIAPPTIALGDTALWPVEDALRAHDTVVIEDLRRFGELPRGAWDRGPREVALVPIPPSGETGRSGVLVVGLNPFRKNDEQYRGFLRLVAGQISASIAIAEAYENEQKRAAALAEIDRAKTAFFSNVSHEFRTPLTLMLGPTEDALSAPDRALKGEDLETVHRNELRLLKLVNTLLDFSRIEAGRTRARYQATDLSALTVDLASAFRSAMERGGLRFDVECQSLPEPVYVDREMWEKIVLNLLSNALKFTFEGSVRIALRPAGSRVELEVSDTGAGIAEHELPRLFERFHRVEGARSRSHEGSGIGLSLVRDLVVLHGGEIAVQSVLGCGTSFTVSLPTGVRHLPAEALESKASAQATVVQAESFVSEALRWLPGDGKPPPRDEGRGSSPGADPAPRARVLVVDDNADMRDYVARLLSPHWAVETAGDGEAALEAIRREPPDLVLSDVMMPLLDGIGLVRALRDDPATRTIPIILLSARAGEEATAEGLRTGADDYLVKPFSASALVVRVEAQLSAARARGRTPDRRRRARAPWRPVRGVAGGDRADPRARARHRARQPGHPRGVGQERRRHRQASHGRGSRARGAGLRRPPAPRPRDRHPSPRQGRPRAARSAPHR